MIHYIYKIIFLRGYPIGRYYLGKRSFNGNDLSKDNYSGSGSFCKAYFKKYGKHLGDTYLKEIVEINPSAEINKLREIAIIGDKYKTDLLCMNIVCGGGGGELCTAKAVLQYNLDGELIEIFSSETSAANFMNFKNSSAISKACINKAITSGGFIWRFEDEPLKKSELKEIQIHSKPIKQYTEDGIFIKNWNSIKEASENLNISATSIGEVCNHSNKKRHLAGGFLWSYYNETPINNKKVVFRGKRKVQQIDPNTLTVIQEFDSLADAANTIGGTWQGIQRVCNGNRKRCHGFIWKFKD